MTDLTSPLPLEMNPDLDQVRTQLNSGLEKNQLQFLQTLTNVGESVWDVLMEFLIEHQSHNPTLVMGKVYQVLYSADSPKVQTFLQTHFPQGIVPLRSQANIDYSLLQHYLAEHDFLEADKLTLQKLCELAGPGAIQRKWIYFSEVERLPIVDLQTLDTLWRVHSEGKFGYSVQRELWLSVNRNWDKLWPKIGWKTERSWTRYPKEFTWNLNAPKGHLPLSNQLRGVRVIEAVLSHPAWSNSP